jgi:hypothetical protein
MKAVGGYRVWGEPPASAECVSAALYRAVSLLLGLRVPTELCASSFLRATIQDRNPEPPDAPGLCGQEDLRRQEPLDRDRRSLVAPGPQRFSVKLDSSGGGTKEGLSVT